MVARTAIFHVSGPIFGVAPVGMRVILRWLTIIAGQGVILRRRHRRQLLQKRNDVPDRIVVVRGTPRRHRRHFDAVLDYPELTGGIGVTGFVKIGRPRVQALAYFRLCDARCAMATGAHLSVMLSTFCDEFLFAEV